MKGWRREKSGPADLVEAARAAGVRDGRVLDAIAATPRADFVPEHARGEAYRDGPVPLPGGQTTSQPSLVATMVEALSLEGSERVLEVGTGYGWQTALLARLAARVWSVERLPELAETARGFLHRAGLEDVAIIVGDGTQGLPQHAPFDAIVVSAAFHEVPPPLGEQLAEGGRLVQPMGRALGGDVVLYGKEGGALVRRRALVGARFVPLIGEYGARR